MSILLAIALLLTTGAILLSLRRVIRLRGRTDVRSRRDRLISVGAASIAAIVPIQVFLEGRVEEAILTLLVGLFVLAGALLLYASGRVKE